MATLSINGRDHSVDVPSDTPLLWLIRGHLQMTGTKFGCGAGLCGACHIPASRTASARPEPSPPEPVTIATLPGNSIAAENTIRGADWMRSSFWRGEAEKLWQQRLALFGGEPQ